MGPNSDLIHGDFDCKSNFLTDLKGAPEEIGFFATFEVNRIFEIGLETDEFKWGTKINSTFGDLYLRPAFFESNPIDEVIRIFGKIENFFQSLDYHYFRGGNKIDKRRFTQACEVFNITPPDKIENYIWT